MKKFYKLIVAALSIAIFTSITNLYASAQTLASEFVGGTDPEPVTDPATDPTVSDPTTPTTIESSIVDPTSLNATTTTEPYTLDQTTFDVNITTEPSTSFEPSTTSTSPDSTAPDPTVTSIITSPTTTTTTAAPATATTITCPVGGESYCTACNVSNPSSPCGNACCLVCGCNGSWNGTYNECTGCYPVDNLCTSNDQCRSHCCRGHLCRPGNDPLCAQQPTPCNEISPFDGDVLNISKCRQGYCPNPNHICRASSISHEDGSEEFYCRCSEPDVPCYSTTSNKPCNDRFCSTSAQCVDAVVVPGCTCKSECGGPGTEVCANMPNPDFCCESVGACPTSNGFCIWDSIKGECICRVLYTTQ